MKKMTVRGLAAYDALIRSLRNQGHWLQGASDGLEVWGTLTECVLVAYVPEAGAWDR